jgi:UDP-galactopyranose mutase
MWLYSLVLSITILIAWTLICPQEARKLIAELKRKLRLWVIRKSGDQAIQSVTKELYQRAVKAGYDPDLVKEILEEDRDIIHDRLGRLVSDDILGEPSPFERYG